MKSMRDSTSEDDDLYSGYNEFPSALATDDIQFDSDFQSSARNLQSRRPTAMPPTRSGIMTPGSAFGTRLGTAAGFTRQGTARTGVFTRGGTARPITGIGGESGGLTRPMTAVRGAGYTASGGKQPGSSSGFPQNSASLVDLTKVDDSTEEKIKLLEGKINDLIEQSILRGCEGDSKKALELAKDAAHKEKSLMRLKEQAGVNEGHDWDITFSVLFNLASQYETCEMYTEALTTYNAIAKNKFLLHGAKVKINMGNIYFKQNNPTKAIKMYRMAMDQLDNNNRHLKLKLMHNMGIVFLKMGHATDAAASFEYIMQEKPSFKTGLHLVVSNYMANDTEKMKRSFQDLLDVPMEVDPDDDKYSTVSDDPVSQLLVEVLKNDKLRKLEKERKLYGERCVLSAARLIAPVIESTFADGYHWVTEAIKVSKHAPLAHALEISKALVFLKQRNLPEATEILKSFEKKETKVATAAATNLSFMFFLQGEYEEAEKYGKMATKADFYNSNAYVNLGNCHFARGEYEEAKRCYGESIGIDSSCIEAIYNLAIVNQTMKFYEDALECFHKVYSLLPNHPHVTYQLGKTHELLGELDIAAEWYLKALALAPSDSGILKRLGQLADMQGDRQQAYQHFYDCHKFDPSDLEVVEWLANYLQKMELPEKAIVFYEKAMHLEPGEIRWQILLGVNLRRTGNLTQALQVYQKLYRDNPDNVQILQTLVKLAKDVGLKETEKYEQDLKLLERSLLESAGSGRGLSGRSGRTSARYDQARSASSGHQVVHQQSIAGPSNLEVEYIEETEEPIAIRNDDEEDFNHRASSSHYGTSGESQPRQSVLITEPQYQAQNVYEPDEEDDENFFEDDAIPDDF